MPQFNVPGPFPNTNLGTLAIAAIQGAIANTIYGTTVYHYQAQHAGAENYDSAGRPDYLAADSGVYGSGIVFVPNPQNPLKGIFCQAPRQPYQDVGGIYYTAQMELYLPVDLGPVFQLDGKYPKRQDRFEIHGRTYYAIAPSMPCMVGDTTGIWKIQLNLERYPVRN